MSTPTSTPRGVFGGAITMTLPADIIDASEIRQVPDTQELFLFRDSDISIILEVLERVEPDDPSEAITFHFNSIAHDNDAQTAVVHAIEQVPATSTDTNTTPPAIILYGTQHVAKFNRPTPDEVRIFLAVFRVASKNVDLVLTFNVPVVTEDNKGASDGAGLTAAKLQFEEAVRSLKIVDLGLFV